MLGDLQWKGPRDSYRKQQRDMERRKKEWRKETEGDTILSGFRKIDHYAKF